MEICDGFGLTKMTIENVDIKNMINILNKFKTTLFLLKVHNNHIIVGTLCMSQLSLNTTFKGMDFKDSVTCISYFELQL